MDDCLSCRLCSPNYKRRILRCKADMWENQGKGEKIIKLSAYEAKSGEITWRDHFKTAKKCILFDEDGTIDTTGRL